MTNIFFCSNIGLTITRKSVKSQNYKINKTRKTQKMQILVKQQNRQNSKNPAGGRAMGPAPWIQPKPLFSCLTESDPWQVHTRRTTGVNKTARHPHKAEQQQWVTALTADWQIIDKRQQRERKPWILQALTNVNIVNG